MCLDSPADIIPFKRLLVASFALVAGFGRRPVGAGDLLERHGEPEGKQSIRVKVIDCVAGGSEGHHRLTDAVLSGDDIPSTAETVGREDVSFENRPSFDLVGGP
jgi:hypothetical protein